MIRSWVLRVATAAALGVEAVVHWQNAPAYDAVTGTVSQGALFRTEAVVAVVAALLVLIRPRRSSWMAALLVAGSALGAVLLYRYVDVGSLGPLPDMYENTWQVPGKLLSAAAEAAAVVLAALGLLTHRGAAPPHEAAGSRLRVVRPDRDRAYQHDEMAMPSEEGDKMPVNLLTRILYTAEAIIEGGRAGHGRTTDGRLDLQLSVPEDMGGPGGPGTNPEQLFAVGFGACFQSSLLAVAQGRKLDASDTKITARVGIGPTGHGGFGLQVALDLHAPHLSPAEAADLMARADQRCPYSNATRGNIQVTLSVDGTPLQQAAA